MRAEGVPHAGQARDVVAFGQEVGRVLSDGRVVGRAEPFAKVFPSSRAVKQAVGPTAWVILEDIALDARLDGEGRLVADTNVRRIAGNLALAPNTVARHLGRLRDHGFVLHEEGRPAADGRFVTARYVLDPSAAVERFTLTPAGTDVDDEEEGVEEPCRSSCDTDPVGPCRKGCDTVPCRRSCDTGESGRTRASSAVSQSARHRDLRHNRDSAAVVQQQQPTDADPEPTGPGSDEVRLVERLTGLGVEPTTAASLVADHPAEQVRDALDAVPGVDAHKPAGWVVAAVRSRWDVADLAAEQRRLVERRRRGEVEGAARAETHAVERSRRRRAAGWTAAAVAALDDDQLVAAVVALTHPLPGLGRRSLPAVRARLATFAAATHTARPDLPLAAGLSAALEHDAADEQPDAELPPPPQPQLDTAAVDARLRAAVDAVDAAEAPPTTDENVPTDEEVNAP